jgi:hypothetical protein
MRPGFKSLIKEETEQALSFPAQFTEAGLAEVGKECSAHLLLSSLKSQLGPAR